MPSKKKNKPKVTVQRKVSMPLWQVAAFILAFGAVGSYAIISSFASSVSTLPKCTITPSTPLLGDKLTVTVTLPPVPSDSRDGIYWVKNQTPYNTAYDDRTTYDANTSTATFNWPAETVKGKYAFYFTYFKDGAKPDYVAKKDIVRVSQTCSVQIQ